jgi:hypothetical protein
VAIGGGCIQTPEGLVCPAANGKPKRRPLLRLFQP